MNILHVSNTDLAGGRFTGYYMQQAVDDADARIEMAVWEKESENPNVHQIRTPRPSLLWLVSAIGRRLDSWLGLEGLTGLGSLVMPFQPYFRHADVLHLHLIHNGAFFSMLALPAMSRLKPIVWTIHDCWPTTGMCVYPFDCERWLTGCAGRCPYPRGKSPFRYHIPALHWRIKQMVYKRTKATLVVASKWMQAHVQRSPLLRHLPCHLIPFGVDLETFAPRPKEACRTRLGIRPDQRVLAFRGTTLKTDRYKGMRWLKEALSLYEPRQPTCLLILDDGRDFVSLCPKYGLIDLRWTDGDRLVDALCAADLFLMPSIQEAFGLMAVESIACGTPVVVFDNTALPDVIKAPRGGLAVGAKDAAALAGAIDRLLEDNDLRLRLGQQGRQIAEQEYSLGLYVQRHLSVYEAAMERHRKGGSG
ncbi:MAG TPA: glycosyltransferase [Anaerolineae bacterium]|nr:glycosyltransferase [Anaerolineae bacterium]